MGLIFKCPTELALFEYNNHMQAQVTYLVKYRSRLDRITEVGLNYLTAAAAVL